MSNEVSLFAKDATGRGSTRTPASTDAGLVIVPLMEKSGSNASSIGLGIIGAPGVEVSQPAVRARSDSDVGILQSNGAGPLLKERDSLLATGADRLSPSSPRTSSLSPSTLSPRPEPDSPYLPLFPTPNPMTHSPYTPFPDLNSGFPRRDERTNGMANATSDDVDRRDSGSSPTSRDTTILTPPSPASPAFMRAAYTNGSGHGSGVGGFEKWRRDIRGSGSGGGGGNGFGAFSDSLQAVSDRNQLDALESPTKLASVRMSGNASASAERPRPMLMRTPPTNALLRGPEMLNGDHFGSKAHEANGEDDEHLAELPMSPHRLDFGRASGGPYSPIPPISPPPIGRRASGPGQPQAHTASSSHSRHSSNLNPYGNTPPSPLQPSSHRVHARNLSLFFPEPGKSAPIPSPSFPPPSPRSTRDAPITTIPSPRLGSAGGFSSQAGGSLSKGSGFKFGGTAGQGSMGPPALPPIRDSSKSPLLGLGLGDGAALAPPPSPARFGKRGHHHKHSLSHNFFSFLDPTATNPAVAEAGPSTSPEKGSPTPSPSPHSSGLATPKPVATTFVSGAPAAQSMHRSSTAALLPSPSMQSSPSRTRLSAITDLAPASQLAIGIGVAHFFTGAALWVEGQASGSVGLTGLGYLVVFDAMGILISVAGELMKLGDRGMSSLRRPFGSYRTESLLYFVQAIFLLFASVYIAKEAVEHVLISGHDHHADFNEARFPSLMLSAALLGCFVCGGYMRNHAKLVEAIGPKFTAGFRIIPLTSKRESDLPSGVDLFIRNPFSAAIACMLGLALAGSVALPGDQFVNLDKVLALAETFITFRLSYPASIALGQVLLQTSPPETNVQVLALHRAVEEVEGHPAVISVGTPHVWQLTPHQPEQMATPSKAPLETPRQSPTPSRTSSYADLGMIPGGASSTRPGLAMRSTPVSSPTTPTFSSLPVAGCTLVATIEICVREDADDRTVLDVTRFAYERCNTAIGVRMQGSRRVMTIEQGEVTVMVRKGRRERIVESREDPEHDHHHHHDHDHSHGQEHRHDPAHGTDCNYGHSAGHHHDE